MHNSQKLGRALRALVSPILKQFIGGGAPSAALPSHPTVRAPVNGEKPPRKGLRLSLALQGGGSFGAFTWGVLDRLLEEKDVSFDAVSGASAGAINAIILCSGLARGGKEGGREALHQFWEQASRAAPTHGGVQHPSGLALDVSTRLMSPYQFNPLDFNPLRALLGEVDFEALRKDPPLRLLIGATRVSDGGLRVFREHEITQDVVLASACLPLLQHAVTIDGEAYWDGGYAANPPLLPLVAASRACDILVVQIIPTHGEELPRTSPGIIRRLNQMTFNNSLLHDLENLSSMMDLAKEQDGKGRMSRKLRRLALHRLSAEEKLPDLGEMSAFNLDWDFLTRLRDAGRTAASEWIEREPRREAEVTRLPEPEDALPSA
ncbi:MAG: patatin-like phospholipase family protein [Hyphomicrobiales bacterium]|nr:patatin-like phospholipase family protein [Hyphomicrobiales bacterium]